MSRPVKVTAAGACLLRGEGDDREVLLIHRPRYADWTLPKGKPKPDEDLPVTAVREVLEESGCLIRLGVPLGTEVYTVSKGRKRVHWWLGQVISQTPHPGDHEVDKVVWYPIKKALKRLTWSGEREIVKQALAVPPTSTLVIVRHGKAMDRNYWSGSDKDFNRPLSGRGRRQAARLTPLLHAYGVARAVSSSSVRCLQTLEPFAESNPITVEPVAALSEESFDDNPGAAKRAMRELRDWALEHPDQPVAVSGHRPVLPAMRDALNAPHKAMLTGEAQVLHLDAKGKVVAAENHKSRF